MDIGRDVDHRPVPGARGYEENLPLEEESFPSQLVERRIAEDRERERREGSRTSYASENRTQRSEPGERAETPRPPLSGVPRRRKPLLACALDFVRHKVLRR